MNTVRTTITLPADLHKQLRIQAIEENLSLGELITKKFSENKKQKKSVGLTKKEVNKI